MNLIWKKPFKGNGNDQEGLASENDSCQWVEKTGEQVGVPESEKVKVRKGKWESENDSCQWVEKPREEVPLHMDFIVSVCKLSDIDAYQLVECVSV